MSVTGQTMLDADLDWPEPLAAAEPLSADRRRTQRQHQRIEVGVHPLTGGPLHQLADTTVCAPDAPKLQPFTCGSCRFRQVIRWHDGAYPKCLQDIMRADQDGAEQSARPLDRAKHVSHGAATDCRAWWPACVHYEAGDAGVSADAARVIPTGTP